MVGSVPDTKANPYVATLQEGDIITHANGEELSFFNGGFPGITENVKTGEDITFTIVRNGDKVRGNLWHARMYKYIVYIRKRLQQGVF